MYVLVHAVLILENRGLETICIDTNNHASAHEANYEGMYRYKSAMYRLILKGNWKTGF